VIVIKVAFRKFSALVSILVHALDCRVFSRTLAFENC
jgi:hypothetical protein